MLHLNISVHLGNLDVFDVFALYKSRIIIITIIIIKNKIKTTTVKQRSVLVNSIQGGRSIPAKRVV